MFASLKKKVMFEAMPRRRKFPYCIRWDEATISMKALLPPSFKPRRVAISSERSNSFRQVVSEKNLFFLSLHFVDIVNHYGSKV